MFSIYHNKWKDISSFLCYKTVKSLFNRSIEIGTNAITVTSVVVVRIAVVVGIGEIRRRNRKYPNIFILSLLTFL